MPPLTFLSRIPQYASAKDVAINQSNRFSQMPAIGGRSRKRVTRVDLRGLGMGGRGKRRASAADEQRRREQRPVGLIETLTATQLAAALDYDGPETLGVAPEA
jgi:hypothetical protein